MIEKQQWIDALKQLGVQKGMLVIVDGLINDMDQTINQANAFVDALLNVVSSEGTVVCFYTNTNQIEPSQWDREVPIEYYQKIRKGLTHSSNPLPTEDILINTILLRDDGIKKRHPLYTVIAIGKYARFITRKIPLNFPNGAASPMQGCIDLKGYILVLNELSLDSYPFSHGLVDEQTPVYVSGGIMVEHGISFWQKFLHHDVKFQTMKQAFLDLDQQRKVKKISLMNNTCSLVSTEYFVKGSSYDSKNK